MQYVEFFEADRRPLRRLRRRWRRWRRPSFIKQFHIENVPSPPTKSDNQLLQQLDKQFPVISKNLKLLDDAYQRLIHNTVDRLYGRQYQRQLKLMSNQDDTELIPPHAKMVNRRAGLGVMSILFVVSGSPVLILCTAAINLYLSIVVIREGIAEMLQRKRITDKGKTAIIVLGLVFGGVVQTSLLLLQGLFLVGWLFVDKLLVTVYGQSQEQLVDVFGQLPQHVSLIVEGVLITTSLAAVQAGDLVRVTAGEVIPVDGQIINGYATIDQHALTGESQPAEKASGDTVSASTLVLMGEIDILVKHSNEKTLVAQITNILNNTTSHHTDVALRGIQLADDTAPYALGLGGLAYLLHGLNTMITVWSVPIGSLLQVASPLTVMSYLNMYAQNSVLIKDGRSLELVNSIDTVVFDKTGTLTIAQPTVAAVHVVGEATQDDILALAAAIEEHQSHPIADAIRKAAQKRNLLLPSIDQTAIEVGYGLSVQFNSQQVILGSQRFMQMRDIPLTERVLELAADRQGRGHSIVYLALDGKLLGMIELQPTVRPEASSVINTLHARGITLYMITGDDGIPAQALATQLGIDHVFANVLPTQKADQVELLQQAGKKVLFVGDGINDSIALRKADISVSIRGSTTVATDTAQVILMDGTLRQLPFLFDIAEQYERDLSLQSVIGVSIPFLFTGGVLLFGWGLFLGQLVTWGLLGLGIGVGLRPLWHQQQPNPNLNRLPSSPQSSE